MAPAAPDSGKTEIEEEGGEKRGGEGEMRCSSSRRSCWGGARGWSSNGQAYFMPAMSVPVVRYFLSSRADRGAHTCLIALGRFTTVWACPCVWLGELRHIHGGTAR